MAALEGQGDVVSLVLADQGCQESALFVAGFLASLVGFGELPELAGQKIDSLLLDDDFSTEGG